VFEGEVWRFFPHRFLRGDFFSNSGGRFLAGGDGEVTQTVGTDQGFTLVYFSAEPEPFSSLTPHSQTAYPTESARVEPKSGRVYKGLTLVHLQLILIRFCH